MAKKRATGGIDEGARIRVRPGVVSPEFPDVSLAGWTGTVAETSGKPPAVKVFVEWDQTTLAGMPPSYVEQCEAQNLYHRMACLGEGDLERMV